MSAQNHHVLSLNRDPASRPAALTERLHKVLANAGQGSRRVLEQRIANGAISVNGEVAATGSSVHAGDHVLIDDHHFVVTTDTHEHAQVLVYNKPEGTVVTRDDEEGRPTVFEQLPTVKGGRWIAVGRLDINTTGLLLLTTDGELANALMHPGNNVEREYLCRVHGEVHPEVLEQLQAGVDLEDGPARFNTINVVSQGASHSWFRVTLSEGRNREVRRLWDAKGCMVSRLKRIRYGHIELPRNLRRGQCEPLDTTNVAQLRLQVGLADAPDTLTLSPVLRQRRASRRITEFKPENKAQRAWTGAYQNEARELTAFDRIRGDTPNRGDKRKRRPHGDVNGNVMQPDKPTKRPRNNKRGVAPGQELPSVRTWFAGESKGKGRPGGRPSGNRPGTDRPSDSRPGGNRPGGSRPGGNRPSGSRPGGNRPSGNRPSGNRPSGNRPGNRPDSSRRGGGKPHGKH